ncbi:hypothetical protein [uncultured Nitratireductor sp.]|uniref:hypothetical protein n=1 Tax=uncultured Nitratireductor sp. TaxID=520953 RepID=UPI002602A514|nr:hypothetical protein [uncultured Nitratireductor sp.]
MPNYLQMGYYETGTASIEQGQKVVTGQGTAWSQIVRRGDDFGKHVGRPIPIASVDSDTQITLAYPWPGPTQTAAPYRVTFTPYELNYRQAYPEIDRLLTTGNVSALAGLVGAANKVPMFTGPGAMDLTTLGTASGSDVTTSPKDETAGRLLKVGDNINFYGLRDFGAYHPPSANRNIDTVPVGDVGLYSTSNPGTFPPGKTFFWIETQRTYANAAKFQRASSYDGSGSGEPEWWLRVASGDGTYGPWRSLIPLRGSNANGEYVRFADGTQICWFNNATFTQGGSDFATYTWTLPAPFSGSQIAASATLHIGSASYTGAITRNSVGQLFRSTESSITTVSSYGFWKVHGAPNWNSGDTISKVQISATGRWF